MENKTIVKTLIVSLGVIFFLIVYVIANENKEAIIGFNKFALVSQTLLDGIVVFIGILSYICLIYAYNHFIKGDFKRLLRTMLLIVTLFFIYKFLEIAEMYFEEITGIFIIEQTAVLLQMLMMVWFSFQLLEFSEMYGFRDNKKL